MKASSDLGDSTASFEKGCAHLRRHCDVVSGEDPVFTQAREISCFHSKSHRAQTKYVGNKVSA